MIIKVSQLNGNIAGGVTETVTGYIENENIIELEIERNLNDQSYRSVKFFNCEGVIANINNIVEFIADEFGDETPFFTGTLSNIIIEDEYITYEGVDMIGYGLDRIVRDGGSVNTNITGIMDNMYGYLNGIYPLPFTISGGSDYTMTFNQLQGLTYYDFLMLIQKESHVIIRSNNRVIEYGDDIGDYIDAKYVYDYTDLNNSNISNIKISKLKKNIRNSSMSNGSIIPYTGQDITSQNKNRLIEKRYKTGVAGQITQPIDTWIPSFDIDNNYDKRNKINVGDKIKGYIHTKNIALSLDLYIQKIVLTLNDNGIDIKYDYSDIGGYVNTGGTIFESIKELQHKQRVLYLG